MHQLLYLILKQCRYFVLSSLRILKCRDINVNGIKIFYVIIWNVFKNTFQPTASWLYTFEVRYKLSVFHLLCPRINKTLGRYLYKLVAPKSVYSQRKITATVMEYLPTLVVHQLFQGATKYNRHSISVILFSASLYVYALSANLCQTYKIELINTTK